MRLLEQYQSLFSWLAGCTVVIGLTIEIEMGKIVRELVWPLARKTWYSVRKEPEAVLQAGIIEPSVSPWKSPLVIVPKPEGTIHICLDF